MPMCRGLLPSLHSPRWLALALVLAACADDGSPSATQETAGTTGTTDAAISSDTATADATSNSTNATAGADETSPAACIEPLAAECLPARGFVSTAELDALIGNGDLAIVDVRSEADFEAAHLPGAVWIDPATLRATIDGVPGQVAPEPEARAVFQAAGLRPEVAVVAYSAGTTPDPARVLWTLAYYGHQGPLWLLDGGFEQWSAEGRATDTDPPLPMVTSYVTAVNADLRVDAPWMLEHLDDDAVTSFDARSAAEFDAGHIPGAHSVDWTLNIDDQGLVRPEAERLALHDAPAGTETRVAYCQTGTRAALTWLVLTELGFADVRLYDGSWAEWSANPRNPVEP